MVGAFTDALYHELDALAGPAPSPSLLSSFTRFQFRKVEERYLSRAQSVGSGSLPNLCFDVHIGSLGTRESVEWLTPEAMEGWLVDKLGLPKAEAMAVSQRRLIGSQFLELTDEALTDFLRELELCEASIDAVVRARGLLFGPRSSTIVCNVNVASSLALWSPSVSRIVLACTCFVCFWDAGACAPVECRRCTAMG
jgi:hypothetical protein